MISSCLLKGKRLGRPKATLFLAGRTLLNLPPIRSSRPLTISLKSLVMAIYLPISIY